MVDERASRRAAFRSGTEIVLADGQLWTLADRFVEADDPEYDDTLRAVLSAHDHAERLLAELVVCILLLSRNYALTPEQLRELLSFRAGDPSLAQHRNSLRELIEAQAKRYTAKVNQSVAVDLGPSQNWQNPDLFPPIRLRSLGFPLGGKP